MSDLKNRKFHELMKIYNNYIRFSGKHSETFLRELDNFKDVLSVNELENMKKLYKDAVKEVLYSMAESLYVFIRLPENDSDFFKIEDFNDNF